VVGIDVERNRPCKAHHQYPSPLGGAAVGLGDAAGGGSGGGIGSTLLSASARLLRCSRFRYCSVGAYSGRSAVDEQLSSFIHISPSELAVLGSISIPERPRHLPSLPFRICSSATPMKSAQRQRRMGARQSSAEPSSNPPKRHKPDSVKPANQPSREVPVLFPAHLLSKPRAAPEQRCR